MILMNLQIKIKLLKLRLQKDNLGIVINIVDNSLYLAYHNME